MSYEQKPGQITVWKNEKFTLGGNQPYAKGTGLNLDGRQVDVTLWIPKSDKIKGFNLVISEPYKKNEEQNQPSQEPTDLPF